MMAVFVREGTTSEVMVRDIVVIANIFVDISFGVQGKRFNVS